MANVTNNGFFVQADAPRPPRALLLWPPVYDFALFDLFLKPYALLRLGAWLKRAGYRVRLVNALDYTDARSLALLGAPKRESRGTGKLFRQVVDKPAVLAHRERSFARYGMLAESLEARIAAEAADVVFVSAGMTYWYPGVVEAIRIVKKCFPRVPVVLGGVYPTLCSEHARRVSGADFVVAGPALPGLLEVLQGLSLPVAEPDDSEELYLFPESLWQAGVVRLNRGCPLACAYCSSHRINPGFTPGKPESLLRTITAIHRRYGTCSFAFYDDALLVQKEAGLLPFLEGVIRSRLPLSFYLPNAVHLRFLDSATASAMKRAGFREVRLGFESAQAEFHRDLDRKLDTPMLGAALECLLGAGFGRSSIIAYVLAGMPGQTAGEVEDSIRHAAAFGIRVQVAEYSPTPGSSLWQRALALSRYPLAEEPLTHNNTLLPMEWEGFTLQDLNALKALAREVCSPTGA